VIYYIAEYLESYWSFFHVIHYVSFRAIAALLSTLCMSFLFGNWFIDQSKQYFRSKVRDYTPQHHQIKNDLPTMGGIFMLGLIIINTLLWCTLHNGLVWIFLFGITGFGIIGGWDDWCKIRYKRGISARTKFLLQLFISGITIIAWIWCCHPSTHLTIPFLKSWYPDLGWFFIPWCIFIIIGCSNAVNLTDGLDGLAIGSLLPNFATFGIISYLAGHVLLSLYLHIPFAGTAEIAIIGSILGGASLGFLWYNTYPAQIFMGDVGSLSLGAGLALMALMSKEELLLAISGAIFVFEAGSVILQVLSFKLRGKRLFKMAPIHHHFELLGWQEAKITVRFGIITLIFCLLALITLKIR